MVAVVGKPHNAELAAAIALYEERAARYWPLDVREVREEPARGRDLDRVRDREAERLSAQVGDAELVVCDEGGRGMTSLAFSQYLQGRREAARDVAFVVGGAHGLAPTLVQRAVHRLALASWTLPHEMARLVLAEQLYRAGTIQRGEPYHK
jgi:23S rRNA (pseudouridine1915-N3)-methyltransferase